MDLLARFAKSPEKLKAMLANLPETAFDLSIDAQNWTIRQILHHLADATGIWKGFIQQAIGRPGSSFSLEWYLEIPQDEWTRLWAYVDRPVEPSLAILYACHEQIVQLLEHHPDAWENCLTVRLLNEREENVSIGWVIDLLIRHVTGHIEDICQIRQIHQV